MLDSPPQSKLHDRFKILIKECCGLKLTEMAPLPGDASRRKYFRLHHNEGTLIGVCGSDHREDHSFMYLCKHFYSLGLPVPRLFGNNEEQRIYVVEDLGDETLAERTADPSTTREEVLDLYIRSVKDLVAFQILGHRGLDYENNCHQDRTFNRANAEEDLQYFAENFFLIAKDYSNISGIENELKKLARIVGDCRPTFFLYRDFQCRNIVIRTDGTLGYIDFQAGREGPLQYDVATLLYASQAFLSDAERDIILSEYLNALEKVIGQENGLQEEIGPSNARKAFIRNDFMSKYYFFVLFRILRALGVYLYLADQEGHRRFFGAVPLALQNLTALFSEHRLLGEIFPKLQELAKQLSGEETFLRPNRLMKLFSPR